MPLTKAYAHFFSRRRPGKFSLANGETSLVTLQSGDDHNLHRVDIERGIVVETWVRQALLQ